MNNQLAVLSPAWKAEPPTDLLVRAPDGAELTLPLVNTPAATVGLFADATWLVEARGGDSPFASVLRGPAVPVAAWVGGAAQASLAAVALAPAAAPAAPAASSGFDLLGLAGDVLSNVADVAAVALRGAGEVASSTCEVVGDVAGAACSAAGDIAGGIVEAAGDALSGL